VPQTFPRQFFQVAPEDQWLDRPLAPNEMIILENLHAKHPRLVMTLSGLTPHAIVKGFHGEPIRLQADLLFINTDHEICVLVVGASMGARISPEEARELMRSVIGGDSDEVTATTNLSALEDERSTDGTDTVQGQSGWRAPRPALPFQAPSAPQPPRPSLPDGALPFREVQPPPPPPEVHTSVPVARASTPAFPAISAMPASVPQPPMARPEPLAPPPPVPFPPAPPPAAVAPLPGVIVSTPAPVPPPAFGGAKQAAKGLEAPQEVKTEAKLSAAPGGVFLSAKAASDAAAYDERRREGADAPAREAARAAEAPMRRLAVVDLLSFEPKVLHRLRAQKRFAQLFSAQARPRVFVDQPRVEPSQEEQERTDMHRILSCARSADANEIRRALAESLDDLSHWHPPLVTVAGELRPVFDEIETLRAVVGVAQPVAGGDKRLLAAISVAQEALAASIPPRPDTVLGLARQIEAASASLSLPPRYVASEAERLLLEGRKYKRRPLLGAPRIRADLVLARGGEVMVVYLPDAIAGSLPLLPSCTVVMIGEVRPREDMFETQPEALVALALGRVLHGRIEG
jgi:hypothetical protein